MTMNNKEGPSSIFGVIVTINLSFLRCFLFGALAWLIWPDTLAGYGLGLLAIASGILSFSGLMSALKGIVKLYGREKALADYTKQGEAPKTSTLASSNRLKNAGMR